MAAAERSAERPGPAGAVAWCRPCRRRARGGWAIAAALATLIALALVAAGLGRFPLAPADVLASLASHVSGQASPLAPAAEAVIWNIRLPRLLATMEVGAALGAAGAVFQAMFRNPLVSPDILGVSAGCGLGASLAILFGLPLLAVSGLAFGGGLLAVGAVMLVARRVGEQDPVLVLVLAGVAAGALLGAGISAVKLLSDPSVQLPAITFWLLGGLHAVTRTEVALLSPALAVGALALFLGRWRLNLLGLPDDEAAALGAHVGRLRLGAVAAATLMTAAAVSVSGIIGWVGLVVPHVARLLVGPEFSRLLPMAMVLGAAFLLVADTLARCIAPIELPLSVLTAGVGAPFFLWLLGRPRQP